MSTRFSCQTCGTIIDTDAKAGTFVECPTCATAVAVGSGIARGAAASSAPAAAPAPKPAAPKAPAEQPKTAGAARGQAPAGRAIVSKYLSAKKHSGLPGTAVLVACGVLVAFLIVVLILQLTKSHPQAAESRGLSVMFLYNQTTDEITVTNKGTEPWTDLVVQVQAGAVTYSSSPATLGAGQNLKIPSKELTAPNKTPFDPFKTPPQSVSFSATLPGGVKGTQSAPWPSAPAATPKPSVGK